MTDVNISGSNRLQNPYNEVTLTIPAGGRVPIYYAHRYFRVMSQTNGTLKVRFDGAGADTSVIGSGIGIEHLDPVDKVDIANTHATDTMTITIALSMGNISDSRLSLTGTITVTTTIASTLTSVADVAMNTNAITLIAALDSTRKAIHVSNLLANAQICRIGDSAITATRGSELGIGETRILTNTAAVYGWFVGATKSIGVLVEG